MHQGNFTRSFPKTLVKKLVFCARWSFSNSHSANFCKGCWSPFCFLSFQYYSYELRSPHSVFRVLCLLKKKKKQPFYLAIVAAGNTHTAMHWMRLFSYLRKTFPGGEFRWLIQRRCVNFVASEHSREFQCTRHEQRAFFQTEACADKFLQLKWWIVLCKI